MEKKRAKTGLLLGFLTIMVLIGTIASVIHFHEQLVEDEYGRYKETILDMAKMESALIELKLEDYINTLLGMAEFVRDSDIASEDNIEYLNNLLKNQDFLRLGLITLDGYLYSTDGTSDGADQEYYKQLLREEPYVTDIINSRLSEDKMILVTVPVYDQEHVFKGVLYGGVRVDGFQPYKGTSLETGNVYSYVITRSGDYIIKNNQEAASWNYENIFEHLEQVEGDVSIETLRKTLEDGELMIMEMFSGDKIYIGCFLPIRNGTWYTLVATPVDTINQRIEELLDHDFYLMLIRVLGLTGVLGIVVLLLNYRHSRWEKAREIQLRERLLLKIIGFMVADIDEQQIVSRSGEGMLKNRLDMDSYPDYIEYMVELGAHPDYKLRLMHFFSIDRIRSDAEVGVESRTMEFLFHYQEEDDYAWLECESHIDRDKETGHLIISHILRDIDSRKREELLLRKEAETDALTGLYNRSAGTRRILRELLEFKPGENDAFILVDLDYFKNLNDTLGHQYGDQALKDVAHILESHVRKDDVVCRLGGDEFVIFLKNIPMEAARNSLNRLLKKLVLAYENEGQKAQIHASAGLTFMTEVGTDFDELYRYADNALYEAKRRGRGVFVEYEK